MPFGEETAAASHPAFVTIEGELPELGEASIFVDRIPFLAPERELSESCEEPIFVVRTHR